MPLHAESAGVGATCCSRGFRASRPVFARPEHASALEQREKVVRPVTAIRPDCDGALLRWGPGGHRYHPAERETGSHRTNSLETTDQGDHVRAVRGADLPRNPPALLSLVRALLMEQDDESAWPYSSAKSMRQIRQLTTAVSQRRQGNYSRSCTRGRARTRWKAVERSCGEPIELSRGPRHRREGTHERCEFFTT